MTPLDELVAKCEALIQANESSRLGKINVALAELRASIPSAKLYAELMGAVADDHIKAAFRQVWNEAIEAAAKVSPKQGDRDTFSAGVVATRAAILDLKEVD